MRSITWHSLHTLWLDWHMHLCFIGDISHLNVTFKFLALLLGSLGILWALMSCNLVLSFIFLLFFFFLLYLILIYSNCCFLLWFQCMPRCKSSRTVENDINVKQLIGTRLRTTFLVKGISVGRWTLRYNGRTRRTTKNLIWLCQANIKRFTVQYREATRSS